MLAKLKQWWYKKFTLYPMFDKISKVVDREVFSGKHEKVYLAPYSQSQWEVRFNIGEYLVVYTYMISGSLIEIFHEDKEVMGYVDQTRQYSSVIFDIHDITYYQSHLENIYKECFK